MRCDTSCIYALSLYDILLQSSSPLTAFSVGTAFVCPFSCPFACPFACAQGVTLFAFDDYFPAVATTDLVCRVADVLCAKPSVRDRDKDRERGRQRQRQRDRETERDGERQRDREMCMRVLCTKLLSPNPLLYAPVPYPPTLPTSRTLPHARVLSPPPSSPPTLVNGIRVLHHGVL